MACAVLELTSSVRASAALRVLVGDDQADVREALRLLLKGVGYQIETTDSPAGLMEAIRSRSFDLILMDMNYSRDTTSGQEGLELLNRLHAHNCATPVIVMTAWGDIDLAVEAMRRGAADFVQKPWDNARLLAVIDKQATEAVSRANAKRLEQPEIEIARRVQRKLLPGKTKWLRTIDYEGGCAAAHDIGGDYYDFLDLGRDQLGFVLADVCGKGLPAALLMANLQASIRSNSLIAMSNAPAMLECVNSLFFDSTNPEHYATLFFGAYDDQTRCLRYVNCGHLAPILLRNNGQVERLDATATVLGMFQNWSAVEHEVRLNKGDTLVAFSDGITEAGIDNDQEFGDERLLTLIQKHRFTGLPSLIDRVFESVLRYSGGTQHDDYSIVAIRAA